ncbi:MAG: DUF1761 domain-containing protein [Acetobacteraceae bacterium]|nr:DUF1761 domain-containing protein [Acetobacteraceae bacterium]
MHGFEVNWLAVLAAAVVRFAIGGVWFAPFAFGPAWGRMLGIEHEAMKARMGRAMVVDFIAGCVLAWVLANLLQFLGVNRLVSGARVSFFLWLGFIAMPFLSMTMYEGRPLSLFAITGGFWLVSLVVMGGLIGAW